MLTTADFPVWTAVVAWLFLGVAFLCGVIVVIDILRRPQRMAVMNAVWPLVMLFGGIPWLWFYWRFARGRPRRQGDDAQTTEHRGRNAGSFALSIAVDTNHCGAGCALGDLVGEALLVLFPGLAGLVGLGTLYGADPVSGWIVGTVLAFGFGVVFQYFAIAPMRHTGLRRGLLLALNADAASIVAWQVGMVGMMALVQLVWLPVWLGGYASPTTPQFWALMQLAMIAGYGCSYPVNWWLVRHGIKSGM